MTAIRWVVVLLGMTLMAGCSPGVPERPPTAAREIAFPLTVPAGQVLLMRRFTSHLVLYDVSQRRVVREAGNSQRFQYEFPDRRSVYTSGDSNTFGFQVIEVSGEQARITWRAGPRQGVFPVAAGADRLVFSIVDYDGRGAILGQHLALYDATEMRTLTAVDQPVGSGVVVGGTLYYTLIPEDSTVTHPLYAVDLGDPAARPRLIRSDLSSSRIYAVAGDLVLNETLANGRRLNCSIHCSTDDRNGLIYSMYADNSQDITLDILDSRSGLLRQRVTGDIVDFRPKGDTVIVYSEGDVAEIRVGARQ